MGFVLASTGYPRCRLLYVHKEKEAKEEECKEEGGGAAQKTKGILAFALMHFMRNGANVIGQPTRTSGPHGYSISLVSIMRKDACTTIYKRTIIHTCHQILANTQTR